ncbi:hypothetical protein C8R45DRAFT_933432 [Mycena sanguinolenta]|nr:hypothetical protein C8R45DRAFT_933432 [Mycena sanguinolenta]
MAGLMSLVVSPGLLQVSAWLALHIRLNCAEYSNLSQPDPSTSYLGCLNTLSGICEWEFWSGTSEPRRSFKAGWAVFPPYKWLSERPTQVNGLVQRASSSHATFLLLGRRFSKLPGTPIVWLTVAVQFRGASCRSPDILGIQSKALRILPDACSQLRCIVLSIHLICFSKANENLPNSRLVCGAQLE